MSTSPISSRSAARLPSHKTSQDSVKPTPETEYSCNDYSNDKDLQQFEPSEAFLKEENDERLKVFKNGKLVCDNGRNGFEIDMMPGQHSHRGGQGQVTCGYSVTIKTKCVKEVWEKQSKKRAEEVQFIFSLLQQAPPEACIMKIFKYEQDPCFMPSPETEGLATITSEYCDGEDLVRIQERYEKARMRIPEKFLWVVYRDMVKALDYLHNGAGSPLRYGYTWRPIVHRDIKPGNIVLRSNPRDPVGCPTAKLIDFDMAGMFDESAPETQVWKLGTYQYQPPEQWLDLENPRATPAGDVYALGATIYHLASGMKTSSGPCHGGEACMGPDICAGHLDGEELEQWKAEREAHMERLQDDSKIPDPDRAVDLFKRQTSKRTAMHISSAGLGADGYSEELDWWVGESLKINPDARMKAAFLSENLVRAAEKRIAGLSEELPRPLIEERRQYEETGLEDSEVGDKEVGDSTCSPSSKEKAKKTACLQARILRDPLRFRCPDLAECGVEGTFALDFGKMLNIEQKEEVEDKQDDTARYDSLYTKNAIYW